MNFIYPNFLWASFFVAVPVIIHLFYFRRYQKVYFSNTALLSEVKNEKSSRNRLKHLLILLTRIFAIIFLVLAFAQPFFTEDVNANQNEKSVSIYIDNSFSMKADGGGQLLIDEAKEIASTIINSYSENEKFQILTNDFEGKHQRLVNKAGAKNFLKDLQISSSSRTSKEVFERQKTVFMSKSTDAVVFQVSDFQKNNQLLLVDSNYAITLVKLSASEKRNIFIDSVWFGDSFQLKGAMNKVLIRFRNESEEKVTGNYQLILNDEVKYVGEYQINGNSFIQDTVIFKTSKIGWNTAKVQISDYPITFDDKYFFSFFVEDKINVLTISEDKSSKTFNAVFETIENVNFKNSIYTSLDYNQLSQQHFIILNQIETLPTGLVQNIKTFIEQGGSVFIVPHKSMSVESYNVLLSNLNIGLYSSLNQSNRKIGRINMEHAILNDLFVSYPKNINLPKVQQSYHLRTNVNSNEQQIMSFNNKESFLSSFQFGNGTVYLLSSPLERKFTDLTTNALFAPMIYKMAILGVNNSNICFEINANTNVRLKKKPSNFEDVLKMSNENIELIPQKNIFANEMVLNLMQSNLEAGIYDVSNENKTYQAKVALNYSRKESGLKYYSKNELENLFPEKNVNIIVGRKSAIQENLLNNSKGKSLWKWFIVFSLLFLAFEILLLRFLKD
ncbi:MAG: hypothetical protein ACI8ZX_001194 [Planctomycetota bacterium]|jgi:hypothetical protein